MQRNRQLIVGSAAVAVLAAGGAVLATVKLASSHPAAPVAQRSARTGVSGFGLGGRLGGRGFGGGLDDRGTGGGGARLRLGARNVGSGGFGRSLGAAANYLGVSSDTLRSDLEQGTTLAEIAKAHGKSVTGLVAALVAARNKTLEQAVTSGRLTAAQEKQVEATENQRIADLVNGVHRPRTNIGSASTATA